MDTAAGASFIPVIFTLTARRVVVRLNTVNTEKIARFEQNKKYYTQEINMNKHSNSTVLQSFTAAKRGLASLVMLPLALIAAGMLAGCQTQIPPTAALEEQAAKTGDLATTNSETIKLREGDVLRISFPSSPTFDTTGPIRRDGKITMQLVGEVDVVGLTPSELEKKLADLYAPQMSSKLVMVEVVSSLIPIYVTGMVLHPGKIMSDHPLTALGAIMEAGGFDFNTANTKDVVVIRREGKIMKTYKFNLKAVLKGKQSEPFFLKPYDIVYVPQRFSMF
jgi:polysaccharide export outer membrane protein